MNILRGSAVKIECEIDSDQVSGTTLTLESLVDPDGVDWASGQSLSFGTGDEANIASMVWQSSESTHLAGKYTFIVKAVNGARENYARGSFYLEAQ